MPQTGVVPRAMAVSLACVLGVAACGTERPSPSAIVPSAQPSAVAPSAVAPSARPSDSSAPPAVSLPPATPGPVNREGYRPIALDAAAVRTIALHPSFRLRRLSSEGPLVAMDEEKSVVGTGRPIFLFDLEKGTTRTLYEAPEGWRASDPVISGGRVAWLVWRYQRPNDTGPLDWSLMVEDLASGSATTIVSGVQRRFLARYGASWPSLSLEGERLAYAVEDENRGGEHWKVIVYSLAEHATEREVPTEQSVYDLAVSAAGDVAYTEGKIDDEWGYTYDTSLFVAKTGASRPVKLASNAFDVRIADGRLVWSQDAPHPAPAPGATRPKNTGAALHTRMWTAAIASLMAVPAAPGPQLATEGLQRSPSTGDGLVIWDSTRADENDLDVTGDRLCVWDPKTSEAYELPTESAVLNGVGGGWIVWTNHYVEPVTVNGAPLSALNLP